MILKFFLSLVALALIVGGLAVVKAQQIGQMIEEGQMPWPASPVTSFTAFSETLENSIRSIGSLQAKQGVTLAAEVGGRIENIHFQSGQIVQAGDPILSLDTSTEKAEETALQASLDLAKIDLDRAKDLLRTRTISQSEFDSTEARYKESLARLENIQAAIDKKLIVAPFSGKLGIRQVDLGQIITSGTAIVSLQNTKQMFINFSLPQRYLAEVKVGMSLRMTDPDRPSHQQSATITTVSPQLDSNTRNISLQAQFSNDGSWFPGMFVEIDLILPQQEAMVLVPTTSVLYAPYGNSVFLIQEDPEDKAKLKLLQKFIKLGPSQGDFVSVEEGVKQGDVVASTGVFKLSNGIYVFVDNTKAPEFSLNPQPEDQ